ncbi:PspC domain-containing protein [Spongisporangium articulatum]|uniref:PspC domain-containing protein n=1 Tax=Spongisporangium articulatum TaxID=3362603 RepID=A0ABW8APA2_9ACTN
MSSTAFPSGPGAPFQVPVRPPLLRPTADRKLAGVAAGVADHLELPVRAVRIAFVVAALLGGPGVVLYAWLWALVPSSRNYDPARRVVPAPVVPAPAAAAPPAGAPAVPPVSTAGPAPVPPPPADVVPPPALDEARPVRWRARTDLLAGVFLLAAGAVLLANRLDVNVKPGLTLPLLIVAAGAVIAYAQLDESDRARWFGTGVGSRAATLRLGLGLVLVIAGILLLVVQDTDVVVLTRTVLAAVAVLGGVVVVLAPWGVRLWRDLDRERAAAAREAERADIAAHLHDSVLQTLALIQRRSDSPTEVARLARAQERDLRGWIYGGVNAGTGTVAARVAELAAVAEDLYGAVVDVVTVGDRDVDERLEALLAALREAIANAARHAGTPVQVYVEFGPSEVEAFVRDRGPGFVVDDVGEDRLGVRESIIGRMERHGGSARVVSTPGEGTEVRLLMPCVAEGEEAR